MPVQRNLKRQLYSITKTDSGYVLNAPKHLGLVLSGGGAKCIGYLGMIQAMYEQGFIQGLTHISGASAGALTASLMAFGVSQKNLTLIAEQLDINKLFDAEGFGVRASGKRLRNILEIIYMQQVKEHMAGIPEPKSKKEQKNYLLLKQKIQVYEDVLKQKDLSINSFQDVIDLHKDIAKLIRLDQAFNLLPKDLGIARGKKIETSRFTFRDLERLRSVLPEDKKHIIKKLSVVTTNQTKNKLEAFNVNNVGADLSIAEKVQQSGAHPVLFVPGVNAQGESIADGGILDNMPIEVLLELGLDIEEILCVKIDADASYKDRIKKAHANVPEPTTRLSSAADSIIQLFLGGRFLQERTNVLNREKILNHIGNMLYINSGTLTSTTKKPTEAQKKHVIANAYLSTKQLLNTPNKTFDTPLLAMLYLGVDNLDKLLILEDAEQEISEAALQAKKIFLLQKMLVEALNTGEHISIEDHILTIESTLQINAGIHPLNEKQQKLAMAFCLKQVDYLTEGKLEHYIRQQIAIAEEQNSPKVSWFEHLLEFLYTPIAWIISLFSCCSTSEKSDNNDKKDMLSLEENGDQYKAKSTPLRLLSMFSHTESEIKPIKIADEVKEEKSAHRVSELSLQLG